MPVSIRNRWGRSKIIATVEDTDDLREAVIRLVKKGVSLNDADLTVANLTGADLTRANFTGANLTGADLTVANLTGANFTGADLTGADLTGADLTVANFTGANLTGADLTGANLTVANLTGANLTGENFTGADLTGADLTGANLGAIFPLIAVPSLHRRILAAIEAGGSLDMSDWHTCETTHCRAGWAVHLAGVAGKVLEACVGPSIAGALIHLASCPHLESKVPNFYAPDDEAMEDIRRLAAMEPELT